MRTILNYSKKEMKLNEKNFIHLSHTLEEYVGWVEISTAIHL